MHQAVVPAAQATTDPWLLLSILSVLILCSACDTPSQGICGSGPAVIEIGVDDPLVPNPGNAYVIDEGNQGGYHVDVSLKVVGPIDPDDVDIRIRLSVEERQVAFHRTDDTSDDTSEAQYHSVEPVDLTSTLEDYEHKDRVHQNHGDLCSIGFGDVQTHEIYKSQQERNPNASLENASIHANSKEDTDTNDGIAWLDFSRRL